MKDSFEEKQISSEKVFDGRLLHVYRDQVLLPNGKDGIREYMKHPGAVCVVPVTDEGNVIVERQFRYPFHKMILEVPAGKLEAGEEPLEAIKRELREETGGIAENYIALGAYYPSVAYTDEVIYLYLATGISFAEQNLDEDEFLKVEQIPFGELIRMVMEGEIQDGKTQTALLKAYYYLLHKN